MALQTRLIAAMVFAGAAMTAMVFAQDAPAPAPQGQAPAGQAPAAPGGRGAGAGRGTVPAPARRGGFTQFTRPLASADVIAHGKTLYEANCASCHASDLRGGTGPNLLRSTNTLIYNKDELVT